MKKKKKISISSILIYMISLTGSYKRSCQTAATFDMFGKRQKQDTSEVVSKDGPKHGEMSVMYQCPLWQHKGMILQCSVQCTLQYSVLAPTKWSRQKKPDLCSILQIDCVLERIPASFGWRWSTSRTSRQFTSGPTRYTTSIKIPLLGTFC